MIDKTFPNEVQLNKVKHSDTEVAFLALNLPVSNSIIK